MDFKKKIEYICGASDIDISEYLGGILESSEINKVYNEIKKAEKDNSNE